MTKEMKKIQSESRQTNDSALEVQAKLGQEIINRDDPYMGLHLIDLGLLKNPSAAYATVIDKLYARLDSIKNDEHQKYIQELIGYCRSQCKYFRK